VKAARARAKNAAGFSVVGESGVGSACAEAWRRPAIVLEPGAPRGKIRRAALRSITTPEENG